MKSKERNFLRKKAHDIEAVIRVGKEGLTDELILSIKQYINKNELVKIKLLQNTLEEINEDFINEIEKGTGAVFIASVGKTAIFFKEKKENNKLGKLTQEYYDFKKM